MKYVKPNAEVIRIENEDIITASGCPTSPGQNSCVNPGATTCMKNGTIGGPNDPSAMSCPANSDGSMPGCAAHINGVTCSTTSNGYMTCVLGFGSNDEDSEWGCLNTRSGATTCSRLVGANSL